MNLPMPTPGTPGTPGVPGTNPAEMNPAGGPGGPGQIEPRVELDGPAFADRLNGAESIDAATKAVEPLRARFSDITGYLDGCDGVLEQVRKENASLIEAYKSGEVGATDRPLMMMKMLDSQIKVQDLSMRVELATKLVEHGTTSVRQISQTQT